MSDLSIIFKNVSSNFLRHTFQETIERFTPLHDHTIYLIKKNIKNTTMQAQPVIDLAFFDKDKRKYKVYFRETTLIHEDVKVIDLPREVLIGWYAHELGHIIDYQDRSAWQILKFGWNYLFSDPCKIHAEKTADLYAIKYGFREEIKAMKKFIIEHADIDEKYRARIRKYYPGPEEIEHLVQELNENEE